MDKYKLTSNRDTLKSLNFEQEKKLNEIDTYGSHATGLCLPWSDIDVVLCKKNGEGIEDNSYLPLQELYTFLQKKRFF